MVKSYNAAYRRFLKTFRKLFRKKSVMKTIFSEVSVLHNGLSHARLFISFPNTILSLLPNIEQKRIISYQVSLNT